jgi:hypothetical protein
MHICAKFTNGRILQIHAPKGATPKEKEIILPAANKPGIDKKNGIKGDFDKFGDRIRKR